MPEPRLKQTKLMPTLSGLDRRSVEILRACVSRKITKLQAQIKPTADEHIPDASAPNNSLPK